jgi:hypothetical protein
MSTPDEQGGAVAPEDGGSTERWVPHAPSVVLGLAVLAVAVLVGLAVLADVSVDLGLAVPVALVALGALLVVGGAMTGLRRR